MKVRLDLDLFNPDFKEIIKYVDLNRQGFPSCEFILLDDNYQTESLRGRITRIDIEQEEINEVTIFDSKPED